MFKSLINLLQSIISSLFHIKSICFSLFSAFGPSILLCKLLTSRSASLLFISSFLLSFYYTYFLLYLSVFLTFIYFLYVFALSFRLTGSFSYIIFSAWLPISLSVSSRARSLVLASIAILLISI